MPLSSNRFLFVMDSSAGMKRHAAEVASTVADILRSSASGQLHPGDSIGIWTFNEDVYTGGIPLQTWAVQDTEEIALRTAEFLRQQRFAKTSRLDMAMAAITKVVKASDIITIFIFSDGHTPMQGTPFDNEINQIYLASVKEMKRDPRPVITVFQGKGGKFLRRYTVNALPWPVVIPELPIPLKIAGAPAAKPAPAITPQTIAATPRPAPAPQPAPATIKIETPALVATTVQPAPIAAPQPPATEWQTPQIAAAPAPFVPPPMSVPSVADQARFLNPPHPIDPPVVSAQVPAEPPVQAAAPSPVASAASPAPPTTRHTAGNPAAIGPTASVPPSPEVPHKSLFTQATASFKTFTDDHRTLLLAGGLSLIVIAFGLIAWMGRRPRPVSRASLITQIINHQNR